jgi:hypothetical protein
MADVLVLVVLVLFFAACALYVRGCDRLIRVDDVTVGEGRSVRVGH